MDTPKKKLCLWCLTGIVSLVSLGLTVGFLLWGVLNMGIPETAASGENLQIAAMDAYDRQITNRISDALEGVLNIEKVYWLNDSDQIAPKPDESKFGTSDDPSQLQWLLDEAAELLDGQSTLFNTEIQLFRGTHVTYYLDETIFCVSWSESIQGAMFTFSEVKIAHASQFRRFLADGTYGSNKEYYCTQMAETVNAVTASNADFYKYRSHGIVVYNGEVHRANGRVDVCCIDEAGEMIFIPRGEITDQAEAEAFVEENKIRFSLSFGPILVEDSVNVCPRQYPLGWIDETYSRAGLGDLGDLHYLLVTAGYSQYGAQVLTMKQFGDCMISFGCEKAYALDGGQTGTIVTHNELKNFPDYGTQRTVSDIIYFATAMPDGG